MLVKIIGLTLVKVDGSIEQGWLKKPELCAVSV